MKYYDWRDKAGMYAIVEIGGQQFRIEKESVLQVPRIDEENGKTITVTKVLLIVDDKKVDVGRPYVKNITITATILGHGKGEKIRVFKKKRRKNYQVMRGHRQDYTTLRIDQISVGKASATAADKTDKPSTDKKQAVPPKSAGTGKATATKPSAKKATPAKIAAKPKTEAKPKKAASSKPKSDTKKSAVSSKKSEDKEA